MTNCSWENGTYAQAVIETQYPSFSPFASSLSPPSSSTSLRQSIPIPIIDIARQTLQNRPTSNSSILNNPMRGQGLLEDGSSADPASLGIAVLMASASDGPGSEVINGVTYEVAAEEELQYQLYNVPRVSPANPAREA